MSGTVGERSAPAPAARLPPVIDQERVRLLAEQSTGAAASTLVGAMLIAAVLAADVSSMVVGAWVLAYLVAAVWRIAYSRQVLAGQREVAPALRFYLGIAVFNGLWTASLPLSFFAALSIEARVALTVVTLLALSAGAATYAAYRLGYLIVLALALPALVYDWSRYGGPRAWIVVTTLLVFGALMVRMSRHLAEVFERSVMIRFEREKVVEQLRLEKEQTELARQQAEEANRAKSRFLANASHDLRQPAHALSLFTAVLEQTAVTDQHRELARHITEASGVLGALLDNLLDISRLEAGIVRATPQPTALHPLLEQMAQEARGMVGTRPIEVATTVEPMVVMVDPVLVQRAVRNLLDNALRFTERGVIRIEARRVADRLEIAVADSGCGIAPEQQRLVFEEFYQVGNIERDHRRGLGLGLSIVTRLAALMDGEVELASAPGEGSTFRLRMPLRLAEPTLPEGAADAPAARVDLGGVRALIVDDERLVRVGVRRLLESWGAEVDEAEGWEEAQGLFGCEPPWSLCLCDLRLRAGEDGIETARRLQARFPDMHVVLVSGDTAPLRIEQAATSGFPLLHKPVAPAVLAMAVGGATSWKQTQTAN